MAERAARAATAATTCSPSGRSPSFDDADPRRARAPPGRAAAAALLHAPTELRPARGGLRAPARADRAGRPPIAQLDRRRPVRRPRRRLPPSRHAAARDAWRRGLAGIDAEARAPPRPRLRRTRRTRAGRDVARAPRRRASTPQSLARPAARRFFARPAAQGRGRHLLRPAAGLERDRLRRPGQPARLRAPRPRPSAIRGRRRCGSGAGRHEPRRSTRRAPSTAARPTCSRAAAGCRCASTASTRPSTSPSSAPARAARRSRASSRASGFSVVCFDAGPYWRPLEDFASDETEQQKLYWTDDRITGGDDPIALGGNNSGRGVGGSTVHFSMISLRWRPGVVPRAHAARLRRRLADQLRGDRALLPRRRAGAQRRRPGALSLGTAARGLSVSRRTAERAGAAAGARRRGARRRLGRRRRWPPCRPRTARARPASTAASATSAARPTPSRARWSSGRTERGARRRGDPRPGHGRPHRDRRGRRARDRRALPPRRPLALPARAQRRRRGLCDRDAAAAAQFGDRAPSARPRATRRAWSART